MENVSQVIKIHKNYVSKKSPNHHHHATPERKTIVQLTVIA